MEKYLNKIKSIVDNNGFERHYKQTTLDESYEVLAKALFEARNPANAQDPSSKDGISNSMASELFARARALATTTHFAHLSTDSFSEHMALATFYEEIVETIDSFCEAYIGQYGKFITLPAVVPQMQIAVDAILEFRAWIAENRTLITDDSSLQNIIDESVELCNTTIYKLQKLK